ncbi:MAG TPA: reverse transcriptase domain-containing protein [Candidatus Nanoarchaeia archaeon]|nr:reverse transcriptase domain-containing protein [Candidatus Nanoarchaeia archaeon]
MGIKSYDVGRASWLNNFNNNSNFNANDRNVNNHNALRGIAHYNAETLLLKPCDLWQELCSVQNLELAYKKARNHKTLRPGVLEFEEKLAENLDVLRTELLFHLYKPRPLKMFILRDPKTRKISKSDFRDRVIHHALCNIIEPLFERMFIHDSYANREGKGTLKAIQRFEYFRKKLSQNNTSQVFILKSDIRHYFDEVDHAILLKIIGKRINDPKVLWLIRRVLGNYSTSEGKGMPLGNLTSQFFANVYLNELDQFVKHKLKAKNYIRYVDDFVILHNSGENLTEWKTLIADFLREELLLDLHPDKTKIILSDHGADFLGLKLFPYHRIMKKRNVRSFKRKLKLICEKFDNGEIMYDEVYGFLEGWIAYAKNADTYNLRKKIIGDIEDKFQSEVSTKGYNRIHKK